MKKYTLVYQAGLANVFRHDDQEHAARILQHAFRPCEDFCRGLMEAGATVEIAWCNRAGDVNLFRHEWQYRNFQEAPFCEKFALAPVEA